MAHTLEPATKPAGPFAKARLSPEEAERLASTFRPCWALDDAPFTGAGSMSDPDVRLLRQGGPHAELQGMPNSYATNGAPHAPPAPTMSHEPENSIIIDRSVTADETARSNQAQGGAECHRRHRRTREAARGGGAIDATRGSTTGRSSADPPGGERTRCVTRLRGGLSASIEERAVDWGGGRGGGARGHRNLGGFER